MQLSVFRSFEDVMNNDFAKELGKLDKNSLLNVAAVMQDFADIYFESTSNDHPFYFGAFNVNKYLLARGDPEIDKKEYESRSVRQARLEALDYLGKQNLVKAVNFNNVRTERDRVSGELYEGIISGSITLNTDIFAAYYAAVVKLSEPYVEAYFNKLDAKAAAKLPKTASHPTSPSYDRTKHQLIISGVQIDIDPQSDQEAMCLLLFPDGKPAKLPIEKGDLFEAFDFDTFQMTPTAKRRASRKAYSAKDSINLKILKKTKTVSEFLVINKTLYFNPKYL